MIKINSYTEANSGGVTNEGFGYFSSSSCVMTSESATHLPSIFATGTFPSGLISRNLSSHVQIYWLIKYPNGQTVKRILPRFQKHLPNPNPLKKAKKIMISKTCNTFWKFKRWVTLFHINQKSKDPYQEMGRTEHPKANQSK